MITNDSYCSYCLERIKKVGKFNGHIQNAHFYQKNQNITLIHIKYDNNVYCPKCSVRFSSFDQLRKHYKQHIQTPTQIKNITDKKVVIVHKKGTLHEETNQKKEKKSLLEKQLADGKKYTEEKKKNVQIKIADNPNYVLALLNAYVQISNQQIYTAKNLKDGLLDTFHVNSLNFIDTDLLKEFAKELYEEDNKMYYVCGRGKTLQLCRAKSFQEWHNMQAFSGIFIPNIRVNDKLVSYDQFTLFVYDAISKTTCPESNKHNVENVTIQTKNKFGEDVSFTAFHCKTCNKFYTSTQAVMDKFSILKYPLFKISYADFNLHEMHAVSELKLYGYSVKANEMSDYERQNLLAGLINYGIISKEKVVGILQHHINFNGKAANMHNAVTLWKADLDYVNNLNIKYQKKITTNNTTLIYKGKKQ